MDVEGVPLHVEVAEEGGHVVARDADVVAGAVEEVVVVQLVGGAGGGGRVPVDCYGGVAVDLQVGLIMIPNVVIQYPYFRNTEYS